MGGETFGKSDGGNTARENDQDHEAVQQDQPNERAASGAQALHYLLASGSSVSPEAVARLIGEHPGERDAMFRMLHKMAGNGYVQQVIGVMDLGAKPPAGSMEHKTIGSDHAEHAAKPKRLTASDWPAAASALEAAADVVQQERATLITSAPAAYVPSLRMLYAAATGKSNGIQLSGAERVRMLEAAKLGLQPAITLYSESENGREWLDEQLLTQLGWLHDSVQYSEAKDRVDRSIRTGKSELIELPNDQHPHEQAAILRTEIAKLIPTIQKIDEQVIRLGHDSIHHEAAALMEKGHGKLLGQGSLVDLLAFLAVADGFLTLSDEEFKKHIGEVHGVFDGVASFSELVKAIAEVTGGAIAITASYAAVIAKLAGDSTAAAMASGLARSTGLIFANVVAGIEVLHGVAVLLDPHATTKEKIDGAVGASSGAAWLTVSMRAGAVAGFAASTAVFLGYAELKYVAKLFWEANLGITTGLMRVAFDTIQRDGSAIARRADELTKAGALLESEKDPEKAAALKRVQAVLAQELGESIDYFIDDCEPHSYESGAAQYPGAFLILLELFAPLKKHKGSKTPEAAGAAAAVALERITWSMAHATELVVASARQRHLSDVEADLTKKTETGGEE